jgi:hypothetical protein
MSHLVSLLGVKRTWAFALHMSAFDPKRTYAVQKGHVRFTPKATLNAFIREGQEDDECGAGLFCASSLQDQDRLPLDAVIELPAVRYVIEFAKRGGRAGSDCGGTAPSGSSAQIARSAGSVIR